MKRLLTLVALLCTFSATHAKGILVEAESFANAGGWSIDQQFIFEMGSPYLLAHGMGVAVNDATTTATISKQGRYHIYVRTYNWTSPWSDKRGAGAFKLAVGGEADLKRGDVELRLHDLTGSQPTKQMYHPSGVMHWPSSA